MSRNTYFLDHPARQGDFAEMRFMARATEMGLSVTKPWGTNSRYDFVVEDRQRFSRVQVKSSYYRIGRRYVCNARCPRTPYRRGELDFIAIYLIPEDLWYIVPASELTPSGAFSITPALAGHRYERYREAWWLLERSPRAGASDEKLAKKTKRGSSVKKAPTLAPGSTGEPKGDEARVHNGTLITRSEMARHAVLCRWRAQKKDGKDTTE